MRKTFRITVDDRSYNVVVEDLDQAAEPPATAVAPTERTAQAAAPRPAPAPAAAPAAVGAGTIAAPIGGVVRSIDVTIGGVVGAGDKVATIEAMKMKTVVVSKIAGKVTNIAAKVNEPVETGAALMTLG
jgi:biotin carboxyl carrier protein